MSIIITQKGEDARKLEARPIPREDYLQHYILKNPEALPVEEIREDIRLLVVAEEFRTSSGPIDLIAVDERGDIYIIETKLYKNPDKRTVLAQVLDYGAALWRDAEASNQVVDSLGEAAIITHGHTLVEALQFRLGASNEEAVEAIGLLRSNVEEGAFRFVVLMDRIDDRLKNLIRFVNENSRFTLYGIELEFYEFKQYVIVIPKMFGAEVRKETSRGSSRRTWNEADFFQDAESRLDPATVAAIRQLYEFVQATADVVAWGTGVNAGTFNPRYLEVSPAGLITVYSDARIALNYGAFMKTEFGAAKAAELAEGVEELLGISPPATFESTYPHLKAEQWIPHAADFIRLMRQVLAA